MTDQPAWIGAYPPGVSATLPPLPYPHIPAMLRAAASAYDAQPAFSVCLPNGAHAAMTFAEVDRLSDAFAVYLREDLRLQPGDRVAIQMPNSFGYAVAAFGILKAGCTVANVNPLYTAEETLHQVHDSGARTLVLIDMFAGRMTPEILSHLDNLILASVVDFFPAVKRKLVQFVLKRVKKQVPAPHFAHTRLMDAVAAGAKRLAARPDTVTVYTDGLSHDSIAALQYTGGTTGVAKGAMLSHGNLMANVEQSYGMLGDRVVPGREVCLTVLPLYHIFAFTINLLGMFQVGGHNVLIPSPRPLSNLKPALETFPISWTSGVNTLFNALCNEDWFTQQPPKHLKASVAAGMALHKDVAKRWEEITQSPVVEGYGLTEASPTLTVTPFSASGRRNTIGIPLPGTVVALLDDDGNPAPQGQPGELCAKGPQVMKGYWNRPEETEATFRDGWLATGDVAVMDETGFFRIVDRKKDVVIVSGFNVYPNEVEECIAKMPGVTEAAVIGVADEATGEAVKAFVVTTDPAIDEGAVRAHCRDLLTAYKVPKAVEFRDDLPKSPVGKILRKDLKPAAS
jgi:long-chain acyl-CoA synthetase